MTDVDAGAAADADWTMIPMEPDDAFTAVSNSRRRMVLLSLSRATDTVAASDLAVEIAAREHGIEPRAVTGKDRTRIYIALTQTHLPTLDDFDAVDYDDRSKQVTAGPATEPLARVVREIQAACYDPQAQPGGDE
jgi:hypothetical protein